MDAPRIGLFGPGRTRNGLGPFLARFFAAEGSQIVAASGRDLARTSAAAGAIGKDVGQTVAVANTVDELASLDIDLLVISAPVGAHRDGLEAALRHRRHCLCEKPLLLPDELDEAGNYVARFREQGLMLFENVQWPYVLPAFDSLHPGLRSRGAGPSDPAGRRVGVRIAMGMAPAGAGFAMVEDALPHFLSLWHANWPFGPDNTVREVAWACDGGDASRGTLELTLGADAATAVSGRLWLQQCVHQPRPAWLELARGRADRVILDEHYNLALEAPAAQVEAPRRVPLPDPMKSLVTEVVSILRRGDQDAADTIADGIRHRARLQHDILKRLAEQRTTE